jgi:hypothetical protein
MLNKKLSLLFLPFLLLPSLFASSINIEKASLRTSLENVKLTNNEDMGLLGLNYLLEPNEYFYYGVGLYSAISGDRGGFFVGGFTAGAKYPIYKELYADVGAYVGGGGGASAGQGGGLMLKGYGGLLYRFNNYSLGLNYSHVNFPNGDINSDQVAVVADVKFDTIFVESSVQESDYKHYSFANNQDYIVATYQRYFPKNTALKRSGRDLTQEIELVGVEYGANISEKLIMYFESAGAMKGATGYMEVLGGLGYQQELTRNTNIEAKLSLGAGGGGEVDTGGGSLTKASFGFNYKPTKSITTGIGAGYYHAFDGGFDATFAKASVGLNANFLSLGNSKNSIAYDSIASQKFNIRLSNQTYIYSDTLSTNPNNKENVQLLGMKLDWFLSDEAYISGQAYGAYKGGAGGYAVGMFGAGYIQPLFYDLSIVTELSLGAAGGGSINTGGGNIIQPMAGLMYDLTPTVSLEAMYGKVIALNGELDSNVVDVSFVYKFNKLVMK